MLPSPASDPAALIVHSVEPLNAEPLLARLRARFRTATTDFYVRNHGAMPIIDDESYRLTIHGRVRAPQEFTLADIQDRFRSRSVMATLQCAGNRRVELQQVAPTSGEPWAAGAIGNAEWTGVSLVDVLSEAGAELNPELHVAFEGADAAQNEDAPDAAFGVSIPMAKATQPDVLLAWAMNGEGLTREHGAPLRVIVPGFAGVRSAKWLRSITVQDQPSNAAQQSRDYLLYPPHIRKETASAGEGLTITAMPLNSAICSPPADAVLPAGLIEVRGYAIASGRAVARVDVSPNGGRDWVQAEIEDHGEHRWSWVFWRAALDLSAGEHDLAVRAWDSAGQTQPETIASSWNFRGYLCAAWNRVRIETR